MKDLVVILNRFLFEFGVPIGVFIGIVIAGYLVRNVVFRRLESWSKNTKNQVDDIIIAAVRSPIIIWFIILGFYVALNFINLPENVSEIIDKGLLVFVILSATLVVANIASNLVQTYASKLQTTMPVTSLTGNFSRVIVFGVGVMVILNTLGISITPILATLGVGGLAVALALQDTLSNLFSGFHILMARQVKVGDYIKLESGEEGYVSDITWRTTKIRMLPNNEVLIPNEKMTKAIITNYYLPDKELAILVNLGVHYKSDLKKVERVTCEVAKEVMKEVTGGVAEFDPFIRYGGFGDSSINLTVIMRAREFVDQYLIKHEFIKKLHERYAIEDITIPYPIRAINYEQEKE